MDLESLSASVELVSAGYAEKFGITRDANWFLLKLQEEVGELVQAHLRRSGQARTKGQTAAELDDAFAAELADVLGQVLLLARHHHVDLTATLQSKWLSWL